MAVLKTKIIAFDYRKSLDWIFQSNDFVFQLMVTKGTQDGGGGGTTPPL